MLAFALRRVIWAIPTLFGVSLVVFLLTTLLPDPATDPANAHDTSARIRVDELRRARFLDLPRFVNTTPQDVQSRVEACIGHLARNDDDAPLCEKRIAQIGGAGLPYLLPRLDDLGPADRGRIALTLAPIARRMGVGSEEELSQPERAALFWQHFWQDRSVDFTDPAVRREVNRMMERGGDEREDELRVTDTFVLREVIAAMSRTNTREAAMRLVRVAAHATGRAVVADRSEELGAVISDWQSWWYVHETDYVRFDGGERVTASLVQTRYSKWVLGAATGQLGLSTRDGAPVFDKLVARAPITLGMALLSLLVSLTISVPVGVLAAWQQGKLVDRAISGVTLAIYSIPTFLVAEVLSQIAHDFLLPVLALSTVSLAVMTQQQRASMIEALGQDYVRVARAKGARPLRVAVVHALRNALAPTVTLAGVQFPALVGGAFVIEEVFAIHGMGWETLRAIESRDAAWIVAVTLLCAIVTTGCLVASDVAHGYLDPRVRERQLRRRA